MTIEMVKIRFLFFKVKTPSFVSPKALSRQIIVSKYGGTMSKRGRNGETNGNKKTHSVGY